MTPVEMLGYVEFPPIRTQPYRLTLGPYGFFWLELHETPEPAKPPEELGVKVRGGAECVPGLGRRDSRSREI